MAPHEKKIQMFNEKLKKKIFMSPPSPQNKFYRL